MFSYSPCEVYRCCQHNVSHGWPYYAEELWLATADRGLCASLYAASEVSAKVGGSGDANDATTVKVIEETDYPFGDIVTLRLSMPKPSEFPLYLRIPQWCEKATVEVNGKPLEAAAKPSSYVIITRQWNDGDTVKLHLPMQIAVKKWEKNHNAVSVSDGPLSFSLKIGEKWSRSGGSDAWPDFEVFPSTAVELRPGAQRAKSGVIVRSGAKTVVGQWRIHSRKTARRSNWWRPPKKSTPGNSTPTAWSRNFRTAR